MGSSSKPHDYGFGKGIRQMFDKQMLASQPLTIQSTKLEVMTKHQVNHIPIPVCVASVLGTIEGTMVLS